MIHRTFPILLLAAALAGCGSDGSTNNSQANAAATDTALKAQPVKDEHRNLTLTPAWLAGRWQTGESDCAAGDAILLFEPNGAYGFMQERGRWTLAGDQLTIEITEAAEGGAPAGERSTVRVAIIGPNEAEFRTPDGPPTRVYRCHAA